MPRFFERCVSRVDFYMPRKGYKHTPETRAKMSAAQRGRTFSSEHRAKISAGLRGRKLSPESIAKMAAANRGRPRSPEAIAKTAAANSGRTRSPESIAKMVAAAQRGSKNRLWRGDNAGPGSKHARAQRLYPLTDCVRCGAPGEHRHHRDRDPGNNEPDNIAILCEPCHYRSHTLERRLLKALARRLERAARKPQAAGERGS